MALSRFTAAEPRLDVRRGSNRRPRQGVPVHRVVSGRQDLGRFEEAVAVGEVGQGVAHDVSVPQRLCRNQNFTASYAIDATPAR